MIQLLENRWVFPLAVAVTGVVVIIAGVLAYDEFMARPAVGATVSPPDTGDTVRTALRPASRVAARWRTDAELTGALIHIEGAEGTGDAPEWTFQFFSPSSGSVGLISAGRAEASLLHESRAPYALPTFASETWSVDSDEALGIWWRQGGGYLVTRRPDSEITMRLGLADEGRGGPVWVVSGSVPGQQSAFSVTVDATDGSIIEPLETE